MSISKYMKKNKNIVVMAWRDMWHPKVGGAERYIFRMVEHLRDSGYNIKYITSMYSGAKKEEIRDGIEYIRMGNPISLYLLAPIFYLFNLKKNSNLLIENFNAVPFNIPIYNKKNITVIHHLQDTEWISAYGQVIGKIASFVFMKMTYLVYRKEKNIVTVSPSTQSDLISKGFKKENISIIYNGIDTKVLESVNKSNEVIKVVSLGRIMPTKHIDKAIEMIEYTVHELNIDNILLQIIGKGDDEQRLKNIVKEKKLEKYVKFLGFISEQEKEEVLTQSHLHIQFSQKEGWGITVIEAASKGTPTICYPVPGLVDSVNDNTGYFVKNNLKDTWTYVIKEIQSNSKEYIDKQRNCLKWSKKFEWDDQKNLFLEKVRYTVIGNVNTNVSTNRNIK